MQSPDHTPSAQKICLKAITFTGASQPIDPAVLADISAEFPFVEWGFLFSKSKQGEPLYPSEAWQEELIAKVSHLDLRLSCHLCGVAWADGMLRGNVDPGPEWRRCWEHCDRVQINPSRYFGAAHVALDLLDSLCSHKQFILQVSRANRKWTVDLARDLQNRGLDVACLLDSSRGTGRRPPTWNEPYGDIPCGFAGGLRPDDIGEVLTAVHRVAAGKAIWLDTQKGVQTDGILDIRKVTAFCKAVQRSPLIETI
jgi:hypothetical protein